MPGKVLKLPSWVSKRKKSIQQKRWFKSLSPPPRVSRILEASNFVASKIEFYQKMKKITYGQQKETQNDTSTLRILLDSSFFPHNSSKSPKIMNRTQQNFISPPQKSTEIILKTYNLVIKKPDNTSLDFLQTKLPTLPTKSIQNQKFIRFSPRRPIFSSQKSQFVH